MLENDETRLSETLITNFSNTYRVHRHRDECGEIIVPGNFGHIYAYSETRLGVLFITPGNRRYLWSKARNRLIAAGFVVVQDGDREGAALFDPMNVKQCRLAIKTAKIRLKRQLTPADAFRRKTQMEHLNEIKHLQLKAGSHVKNPHSPIPH